MSARQLLRGHTQGMGEVQRALFLHLLDNGVASEPQLAQTGICPGKDRARRIRQALPRLQSKVRRIDRDVGPAAQARVLLVHCDPRSTIRWWSLLVLPSGAAKPTEPVMEEIRRLHASLGALLPAASSRDVRLSQEAEACAEALRDGIHHARGIAREGGSSCRFADPSELEGLWTGRLAVPRFLATHDHLSTCAECRNRVRNGAPVLGGWSTLQRWAAGGMLLLILGLATWWMADRAGTTGPRSEPADRAAADALYESGRWADAGPRYEALLRDAEDPGAEPDFHPAYRLAVMRAAAGRLEEALDAFDLARALASRMVEGGNADALSAMHGMSLEGAGMLWRLGRRAEATKRVEAVEASLAPLDAPMQVKIGKRIVQFRLWLAFQEEAGLDRVSDLAARLVAIGEEWESVGLPEVDDTRLDCVDTAARALVYRYLALGDRADLAEARAYFDSHAHRAVERGPLLHAWRLETAALLDLHSSPPTDDAGWARVTARMAAAVSAYRAAGRAWGLSEPYRHLAVAQARAKLLDDARASFAIAVDQAAGDPDLLGLAFAARLAVGLGEPRDREDLARLRDDMGPIPLRLADEWLADSQSPAVGSSVAAFTPAGGLVPPPPS
jgi:tetratricopeptide (TPR) repeat protein